MQSRILFSSCVDKDEHMADEFGTNDEEELEEDVDTAGEEAFLPLTSPSAKTQDRFMPAFSQA